MPRLSVIIVSYNTKEWLANCLRSLDRQTIRDEIEIIVVDNASSDDSVRMVQSQFPRCRLICQDENAGFGAANNVGARESGAPILLFLNPDTEAIDDNCIEDLLAVFECHQEVALGAGTIYDENGELERSTGSFPTLTSLTLDRLLGAIPPLRGLFGQHSARHWSGFDIEREVAWVTAAALWVRREAFEAIGGFDEAIFMYYEDVDLCYRIMHARSGHCHYFPRGSITHYRNKAPLSQDRKRLQRKWLRHFGRKHYRSPQHSLTRLTFSSLCWLSHSR